MSKKARPPRTQYSGHHQFLYADQHSLILTGVLNNYLSNILISVCIAIIMTVSLNVTTAC